MVDIYGNSASTGTGTAKTATAKAAVPAKGSETARLAAAAPGSFGQTLRQVDFSRAADSVGRVFGPGGWGSGVLVDDKGLLATAHHVVGPLKPGAPVKVEIGGRAREGVFEGASPGMDLAFVRMNDTTGLKPVTWGTAEAGDHFTAIGFPGPGFGSGRMRVDGQINAFDQSIAYSAGWAAWQDKHLGTTDTPFLPGQSGGAILNGAGEFIGLAQATMMDSGSATPQAPGFFLPADRVAAAYRQMSPPRSVAVSNDVAVPREVAEAPKQPAAPSALVRNQVASLDPSAAVVDTQVAAVTEPKAPSKAAALEAKAAAQEARAVESKPARPMRPEAAVPQWLQRELADRSKPMSDAAIQEWNRLRKQRA